MSYILDALKKAERDRQRGAVPRLPMDEESRPISRAAYLTYGIVALVLVVSGVLIGVMQGRSDSESRASGAAGIVQTPRYASSGQPKALPTPYLASRLTPSQAQAINGNLPANSANHPSVEPLGAPLALPTQAQRPSPVPTGALPADAQLQSVKPGVTQRPTALIDLSADLQAQIPHMNVLFHAYSNDPAKRMVDINDKPMHEGDYLVPGLLLVNVAEDGMIFDFRGIRFFVPVR